MFLIGITPRRSVAFTLKGSGGQVSDIRLTENCGLLKHLLPVVTSDYQEAEMKESTLTSAALNECFYNMFPQASTLG